MSVSFRSVDTSGDGVLQANEVGEGTSLFNKALYAELKLQNEARRAGMTQALNLIYAELDSINSNGNDVISDNEFVQGTEQTELAALENYFTGGILFTKMKYNSFFGENNYYVSAAELKRDLKSLADKVSNQQNLADAENILEENNIAKSVIASNLKKAFNERTVDETVAKKTAASVVKTYENISIKDVYEAKDTYNLVKVKDTEYELYDTFSPIAGASRRIDTREKFHALLKKYSKGRSIVDMSETSPFSVETRVRITAMDGRVRKNRFRIDDVLDSKKLSFEDLGNFYDIYGSYIKDL